jgi:hypothetical protein
MRLPVVVLSLIIFSPFAHAFAPTDTSLIMVEFVNTKSDKYLHFQTVYALPENRKFEYSGIEKKNYKFSIPNHFPVLFNLNSRECQLTGLLVPSDTLKIIIDAGKKGEPQVLFTGRSAMYCNYYQSLQHDSNYVRLNDVPQRTDKTMIQSLVRIDSVGLCRRLFLQSAGRSNLLPEWFIKFEEQQMLYADALNKLKVISLSNLNSERKIILSPPYLVWISDAIIDNPEALQHVSYYEFLQTYFSLMNKGLNNSGVSSKVFSHFAQTVPEVQNQLKSEAFDYYMAYSIMYYYQNASINRTVDGLLESLIPQFRNKDILKLLLDAKAKH